MRLPVAGGGPGPTWSWAAAWALHGASRVWSEPLATGAKRVRFAAMFVLAVVPHSGLYRALSCGAGAAGGAK